jgi:hypothetical protein
VAQSSFSWYSGSVEKSQDIAAAFRCSSDKDSLDRSAG